MQTNKTTYYQLILDQSGSMGNCISETITGFNSQMDSIRAIQEQYPEQDIRVSLTKFGSSPEHLFLDQNVSKIDNLTPQTYRPYGNTVLLDAIGECLIRLKNEKQREFAEDKATAVIVIITDGFENASRFFTHTTIANLIDELTATDNFTFAFLGATIDSIREARRLNINTRNTKMFQKENINAAFNDVAYSFNEYTAQKQAGNKLHFLFDEKNHFPGSDKKD